jgi:hypothetical protein
MARARRMPNVTAEGHVPASVVGRTDLEFMNSHLPASATRPGSTQVPVTARVDSRLSSAAEHRGDRDGLRPRGGSRFASGAVTLAPEIGHRGRL